MRPKPSAYFRDKQIDKTRPIILGSGQEVNLPLNKGATIQKSYSVVLPKESSKSKHHSYLKKDEKYGYWDLIGHPFYPYGIQWGFDLTDVRADEWKDFKKRHGFKKVDEAEIMVRGKKYVVYRNPDGILMIAEHELKPQIQYGIKIIPLGYIRFEAPKGERDKLDEVLKGFRGSKQLKGTDINPDKMDGGITEYVKEESPFKARFI